jgi:hypothetical protein
MKTTRSDSRIEEALSRGASYQPKAKRLPWFSRPSSLCATVLEKLAEAHMRTEQSRRSAGYVAISLGVAEALAPWTGIALALGVSGLLLAGGRKVLHAEITQREQADVELLALANSGDMLIKKLWGLAPKSNREHLQQLTENLQYLLSQMASNRDYIGLEDKTLLSLTLKKYFPAIAQAYQSGLGGQMLKLEADLELGSQLKSLNKGLSDAVTRVRLQHHLKSQDLTSFLDQKFSPRK